MKCKSRVQLENSNLQNGGEQVLLRNKYRNKYDTSKSAITGLVEPQFP